MELVTQNVAICRSIAVGHARRTHMLGSGVGGLGFGPRAGRWAVSGRGARAEARGGGGGAQAGRGSMHLL